MGRATIQIHVEEAEEVIDRVATPIGGSAHVIIPKDWIGHHVKVLRLRRTQKKP